MPKARRKDRALVKQALQEKSKDLYWDYVFALRKRNTARIYLLCLELLQSQKTASIKLAINVLAQLGSQKFRQKHNIKNIFLGLLGSPKRGKLTYTLLTAIGHNNSRLSTKAIRKIAAFRKNGKKKIRYAVCFALLGVDTPEAINTLIYLSKDKSKSIRDWSVFGLANVSETNSKKLRRALWERVHDEDATIRAEAILGLVARKEPAIVAFLEKEIKRGNFSILLFDAIQQMGNLETLMALNELWAKTETVTVELSWKLALENCINQLKSQFN